MDISDILEEERIQREDQEYKEFIEAIYGNSNDNQYLEDRDFINKGNEVTPSGKQWKIVHTIASQLRIAPTSETMSRSRRFSSGFNSLELENDAIVDYGIRDFDLTSRPSILINSGYVTKLENEGSSKKPSRKYLFLFSNVLLVTIRKDSNIEIYDLQAVIWVQDMRIKRVDIDYDSKPSFSGSTSSLSASTFDNDISNSSNALTFEIISMKTRSRPQMSFLFLCDNHTNRMNWVEDIENVLLAYHKDMLFAKQIGWYHEIILGSFYSAAYIGDLNLLRKHLKELETMNISVDMLDKSGMSALHWAVLRDQEVCARLLLDHGADPDFRQRGQNTSLLLAAVRGNDSMCRLLLEHGADVNARNSQDRGAIFMTVLFGHSSKGFPWLLQLLNSKGLDVNKLDSKGYSALHVCAERNIVRPIRMLVDSGADVNAKHGRTSLTALQMACSNTSPDIETIRSFLDKGAYPNWKDSEGRTALDIVLQNRVHDTPKPNSNPSDFSTQISESIPLSAISATISNGQRVHDIESILGNPTDESKVKSYSKWRHMDDTLEQVGRWTVKIFPVLLEIIKKGGRFNPKDFDELRPSFRAAILEARQAWENKTGPSNFHEYVSYRRQSGERLILHKSDWTKDDASTFCLLCSDIFGIKNRRHHCRACGALVCDSCSTKKLDLDGLLMPSSSSTPSISVKVTSSSPTSASSSTPLSALVKKKDDRVCDGCFNRLCHEANQPSPEHVRVRNLRQCAIDLVQSISGLMDALDESDGSLDPLSRQSEIMNRALDDFRLSTTINNRFKLAPSVDLAPSIQSNRRLSMNSPSGKSSVIENSNTADISKSPDEIFIDMIRKREESLSVCEDIAKKFMEVADGYHRVSKRIIEQRLASRRLWGNEKNIS